MLGNKMKPDVVTAMTMTRSRMDSAIDTPAEYFSRDDICNVQSKPEAYSKQVIPPFRQFGEPVVPSDETVILLQVSGSINSSPRRPNYNDLLITGYSTSDQPKSKGNHIARSSSYIRY
jgi:hypothetical protein